MKIGPKILKYFIAVLFSATILPIKAQIENLPIKEVDGRQMYVYQVNKGETLYSISRDLDVAQEKILEWNPKVAEKGLKAGQKLYFPVITDESQPKIHIVQSKETIYGIAKKYGITQQQLTSWNPFVKDGIRPGQRLTVSDPSLTVTIEPTQSQDLTIIPASGDTEGYYAIKKGDSLYGIAHEFNTTVDKILELNPTLDREKYSAGTVIQLPGEEAAEAVSETLSEGSDRVEDGEESIPNKHKVKKNETFYSISHQYGISIIDLEKANPEVGLLREGMWLNIPLQSDEQEPAIAEIEILGGEAPESESDDMAGDLWRNHETVDISLILPLMAEDPNPSKQALLYREFYKGFLVGLDSLRNNSVALNVRVYDSNGTIAGLSEALNDEALRSSRIIIAPDDAKQMELLAQYGEENDIDILNLFLVNDRSFKTNSNMLQGNIPHEDMYLKAAKGMESLFINSVPVIISRKGGTDDKIEFIKVLKSQLDSLNVPFREIVFDGVLTEQNLNDLGEEGSFVFIPTSGKQTELNKIIPGLIEWSESPSFKGEIMLAGYPEWITFRGETLSNMHQFNTVIYSRFYTVPDDYLAKRVEDSYLKWYGEKMGNYVPRQGLLGFDTATFLVEWLSNEVMRGEKLAPTKYRGVQNSFDFKKASPAGGMGNQSLYLIYYKQGGNIDKKVL